MYFGVYMSFFTSVFKFKGEIVLFECNDSVFF